MCVFFSLLSRPPFVSDSQENKASGGKQTIPGTSFGPSIILGARQTPGKYSGIKHRLPLRERSGTPAIEQAKPKVWLELVKARRESERGAKNCCSRVRS